MPKYLRIGVTVLSVAACVLLIALWVRTYWWWEKSSGGQPPCGFESRLGHCTLNFFVPQRCC